MKKAQSNMKDPEPKLILVEQKYVFLGFIPIVKVTKKNILLGENTIYYRFCGIVFFKVLPNHQSLVDS